MSRPASATGSAPTSQQAPRPPLQKMRSTASSNISLFVSNLRLLDLDRRSDWPDITVRTFDTKDAQQNQKKRISCVEWALYRLFELWDRETTRDKLQPFFPPLEPLQSLNLRAALFRCLNDLKKNDVLGREAILRKTMLDDCKGEKFEEVLLLFSAAVVRKHVLSTRRKQPFSIGKDLAVAKNLSKDQLADFAPLSLAYCSSLTKTLRDRARLDSTLDQFRRTIQERRGECQKRHAAVLEARQSAEGDITSETMSNIRRELRQNWVGNVDGCEALLSGTKIPSSDAYVDTDFGSIWQHFQRGTTPRAAPENVSLLETLQRRVTEQNQRLQQWKGYRDRFEKSSESGIATGNAAKAAGQDSSKIHGLDIFTKHKGIRMEQIPSESMDLLTSTEYDDIVSHMDQALWRVAKEKRVRKSEPGIRAKATPIGSRRTNARSEQVPVPVFLAGSKGLNNDFFSPLKRLPADLTDSPPVSLRGKTPQRPAFLSRTHSHPETINRSPLVHSQFQGTHPSPRRTHSHPEKPNDDSLDQEAMPAMPSPRIDRSQKLSIEPSPLGVTLGRMHSDESSRDPAPSPRSSSPMHLPSLPSMSSSIAASKEHPTRPSLSERARMSMAFRSSEDIHSAPSPSPPAQPQEPHDSSPAPGTMPSDLSRHGSLADRARQSMGLAALNPTTEPRRRTTVKERPHSVIFPMNQFSTPMKPGRASLGGTKDTTPRDNLFSEDAEYASVFKSRPKIAVSPILSPAMGQDDMLPGMEDEVDGSMMRLDSSPLGKFG